MSAVGWVGLGRLGGPCAAALARHGRHTVFGYDVRGAEPSDYDWAGLPPVELVDSITDIVTKTDDVVYVAVQTPHTADHDGATVAPLQPREFEYGYLVQVVADVCAAARRQRKAITLTIVSTVLPGTFDRNLRPLLNEFVTPVYHPFLIAMGTIVADFVNPEMTIFGVDRPGDHDVVRRLYESFHDAPAPVLSITSAELAKVAYNTFITSKIVFVNTLMELCEATGADVDEVSDCLALGTDRLLSSRYLRAGMGDGGACHPRDNLALSALARRHGLSVDIFDFFTRAREYQTRWLADVLRHWHVLTGLPIVILGKAYKPDVPLTDGSPALLLAYNVRTFTTDVTQLDPVVDPIDELALASVLERPAVFFVATQHSLFRAIDYPAGSVVIDPFGVITPVSNVTLVQPGRRRRRSTETG